MWRWEDDVCRCENEGMICVDVKMRRYEARCEDERMKMSRSENERMICEDDAKIWKIRRWLSDPHY